MSAIGYLTEDEIQIKATIYLYGRYADAVMAGNISDEINKMWNQPLVMFPVNGKLYKINFLIEVVAAAIDMVRALIVENQSYEVNFIRIEEKNIVQRSMMGYGLGQNSGHWLVSDNLGFSTTAAHEFGHALGLPHPGRLDYRGTGYPPIMAPRGTIVDSEFQWDSSALAGEQGGTMNPKNRRVSQSEVLNVLKNSALVNDIFIIGELSNDYYNEMGEPEKFTSDF